MDNNFRKLIASATEKSRKILLKELRLYLSAQNAKYPKNHFCEVPIPEKVKDTPKAPLKIYRSQDFLVQVYKDKDYLRLSINRMAIKDSGDWQDGISWEQLQEIKNKIGFEDCDAFEVYPKAQDVVNVANIRHLFISKEPLPFAWRGGKLREQE